MIKDLVKKAVANFCGFEVALFDYQKFGDFSINPGDILKIAEQKRLNGEALAAELFSVLETSLPGLIEKTEFKAGYLNIYLNKEAYLSELMEFLADREGFFCEAENRSQTIVFDYSGQNIAKPFSVGHLRSTVIGQANLNIHKILGFKTVGINHIGDWGTQFGKLIYAIKTWGNEDEIRKNPIESLNHLYVKFHEEAEKDPRLDQEGRAWFKKLENQDAEARDLWKKCVEWSFKEFGDVYKILNVSIDNVCGESFYEDKLKSVISELDKKGLLKDSDDAKIVELDGIPPALIQKSDGATLYMTRDLAAIKYRIETYKPAKIIYHVGNDQSLHFRQLVAVARKLGWLKNTEIIFAGHGMMRLPEGKMSTRKGRTILLKDLIGEAKSRSLHILEQKNQDLKNKDDIAQKIGISAIKYADLSQNRKSDIVFSFDKFISLDGNSGPYLQYVFARAQSLKRKFKQDFGEAEIEPSVTSESMPIAKLILRTKSVLNSAQDNSTPNLLCEHVFQIATEFNRFYENAKIITSDEKQSAKNMYIVELVSQIIALIFDLLGIEKLDEI